MIIFIYIFELNIMFLSIEDNCLCFFFQIIIIVIIFLIFIQFNILILVRVIKEITTLVEPLAEDNYAQQIRYDLKLNLKKTLFLITHGLVLAMWV